MRECAPFSTTPHQTAAGRQYTSMHVMCMYRLCCCAFRGVTGEGSGASEALNDAPGSNHHQQKPWKDTGMCTPPHFAVVVHLLLLPLPPPSPLQTFSREENLSSITTEVSYFTINPSDYHTTSLSHLAIHIALCDLRCATFKPYTCTCVVLWRVSAVQCSSVQ